MTKQTQTFRMCFKHMSRSSVTSVYVISQLCITDKRLMDLGRRFSSGEESVIHHTLVVNVVDL